MSLLIEVMDQLMADRDYELLKYMYSFWAHCIIESGKQGMVDMTMKEAWVEVRTEIEKKKLGTNVVGEELDNMAKKLAQPPPAVDNLVSSLIQLLLKYRTSSEKKEDILQDIGEVRHMLENCVSLILYEKAHRSTGVGVLLWGGNYDYTQVQVSSRGHVETQTSSKKKKNKTRRRS